MKLLLACLLFVAPAAFAQTFIPGTGGSVPPVLVGSSPSGACSSYSPQLDWRFGVLYGCASGQYVPIGGPQITGNRVCSLGDSLLGINSTDTRWGPQVLTEAVLQSKGQMIFVHNGGVSGQTSDQILARLAEVTTQNTCDKVFVDGGTNDLSAAYSPQSTEANLLAIYNGILGAGRLPIPMTIPPRQSLYYSQISTINAWIRRQAAKMRLPLFDYFSVVADTSTGNYKAGYSSDSIHPVNAALRLLGAQAVADTAAVFGAQHALLPMFNTDPTNIIPNGLMINSSAGVPTGWTTSSPSTHTAFTVATDANITGNAFIGTKTVAGSSDNDSATVTLVNNTAVIPGHTYAFTGKIVTTGVESGSMLVQVALDTYTAGFATNPLSIYPVYVNQTTDIPAGQWYMEFTMPANVTIVDVMVTYGTGTGVVKVGQIGLYDLTALGLQ